MTYEFYSRGKILITGEYLVLKGAKALALPLNVGQKLKVQANNTNNINWVTLEKNRSIFTAEFDLSNLSVLTCSDAEKAKYIANLLLACKKLNPQFLLKQPGFDIYAHIEFDMQWGLGTSSTLINNLAQWSGVNPFQLNNLVSKGSGYDIACASANQAILYQLNDSIPNIALVDYSPIFHENLTLVHLNKKIATENNISQFLQNSSENSKLISKLNILTQKIIDCQSLLIFMKLIAEHELLISDAIKQTPVKQKIFPDFEGEIKSLGAWGGDFVLAASENNYIKQKQYFNNKGFKTVMPFKKLMI